MIDTNTTRRTDRPHRALIALTAAAMCFAAPAAPALAGSLQGNVTVTFHASDGVGPIEIAERKRKRRKGTQHPQRSDPLLAQPELRDARDRRRGGGWDRGYERRGGFCRPRRAIRKAWRMGVDAPRIHRIGSRAVVVSGYRGRHYVRVRFAHARRCPVLAVRHF